MFDDGFFGGLFEFDGDGKLDSLEQAMDFAAFVELMDDSVNDNSNDFNFDEE